MLVPQGFVVLISMYKINHGLLDVDMKITGATIYEHECEGVHVVYISRMGKKVAQNIGF